MSFPRKFRFLLTLLLIISATCLILLWLDHTTDAVRAEARERFFEQYNRQQYLMAELASHTLEEMFATIHRDLDLVVSLFERKEVNRQRAGEVQGTLQKIYESLAHTPVIDLVIFDKQGTTIGIEPSDPYTLGRNYAWRDYFRWARDEGKPGQMYLSPFMPLAGGQARGDKALIVAEGIYDPQGEFLGVATFTLNFDELVRKQILPVRIGTDGYAWLVDTSNRTVLVDPNGNITGMGFEEAFLPRWSGLFELLVSMEDGEPGSGSYVYQDPEDPGRQVSKLVSFHPVRIADRIWTIGVATPRREVETLLSAFLQRQEALATTLLATVVGIASLLLALLVTWNRVLSARVERHTRNLNAAHARLESTFEELLAARKVAAVGHLALGLAHEIRNPLSAIQMNMQMIRKKIDPSGSLRENFSIVEEEIQRLNYFLKDVMNFARPCPLRLRSAELGDIVRRMAALMAERFESENVRTDIRIESPLRLRCDPEQIYQVLLNLILNALEAMEKVSGEKRLGITASTRQGMAVIRVSDTGPGIPPEKREQLFDPFFTTRASGGGLGLSILQTIVLRHGGSVEIESEPGEGATFLVTLPLHGPAKSGDAEL